MAEGLAASGPAEDVQDPLHRLLSHRLLLIGATNVAGALSAIIVLPLLTKNLPASDYGVWVLVLATVTLMPLVVNLGLPGAMVRFLAAERDGRRIQEGFYSVLLVVLAMGLAVSLVILIIAPWASRGALEGKADVIRVMALVVVVDCLNSVLFNHLRTFQRIKRYSGFIILQTFLLVGLLALTVLSGWGLMGAVVSLLASRAVTMVSMLGMAIRDVGLGWPRFNRIREFAGYGLPLIPGDISDWALTSSDRYLIGMLLGTVFVGYYSPGYSLAALLFMLVSPLRFLLPAALSELFDNGRVDRVRTYLRASLKYFLLLAIPAAVGLSLLSQDILEVLTTEEIASEGHMIIPIIATAMLLYGTQVIFGQVLLVEKQTRKLGAVMASTAGINIAMNLALLSPMGIVGAALATLASYAFALTATVHFTRVLIAIEVDVQALLKSLAAAAIMGVALLILRFAGLEGGLAMTALAIVAGIAVYLAVTLALRTLSREERRFFLGLLRSTAAGGSQDGSSEG